MKKEIDASNQSLGRVASHIAGLLRGKDSPSFTPNQVPDSIVVVKNTEKIRFLGSKLDTKRYYSYSGYPGGMSSRSLRTLWESNPQEVLRKAVYNMLPKNRLRDRIIQHLKFE